MLLLGETFVGLRCGTMRVDGGRRNVAWQLARGLSMVDGVDNDDDRLHKR